MFPKIHRSSVGTELKFTNDFTNISGKSIRKYEKIREDIPEAQKCANAEKSFHIGHLRRNTILIRSYEKMIKVCFICHGNICRSPMAEFVFKDIVLKKGVADLFEIASCATSREEIGCDIHYGTKDKLKKEGIAFTRRRAVQLTREDYEYYDYLLAMDTNNLRNINRIIGSDSLNKVHLLLEFAGLNRSIADPWYTGDFDETYKDVCLGCEAFFEHLKLKGEI